jgi:hypothetical protein
MARRRFSLDQPFALEKAAQVAMWSVDATRARSASELLHKLAVTTTVRPVEAFGISALALELPLSTHGDAAFDRRPCPERKAKTCARRTRKWPVLRCSALGGRAASDDASESAYYIAAASALANAVSEAAHPSDVRNMRSKGAAPPLLNLLQKVAARFSIQVSEKAAAQAVTHHRRGGRSHKLNWHVPSATINRWRRDISRSVVSNGLYPSQLNSSKPAIGHSGHRKRHARKREWIPSSSL